MDNAIPTRGLTKLYSQAREIQDLDLQVRQGEVFGFLGPNCAGKTTTIRLLLNLLQPTRGSATIMGMNVVTRSVDVRRACGVGVRRPCVAVRGATSGEQRKVYTNQTSIPFSHSFSR